MGRNLSSVAIIFLFQFKSIKGWNTKGKKMREDLNLRKVKNTVCLLLMSVCKGWMWV